MSSSPMGGLCSRRSTSPVPWAPLDQHIGRSSSPVRRRPTYVGGVDPHQGRIPSVRPWRPGTDELTELELTEYVEGDDEVAVRGASAELERRAERRRVAKFNPR